MFLSLKKEKLSYLIFASLSFLASFSIYIATLRPGIGRFGDSAKFQFFGKVLGIAGPTGYPSYMLVNKLFSLLPFGSLAWRINMMSALFGSLTVLVLYFIIRRLTKNNLISFLVGMVFACSTIFWSQCNISEVYTFNSFFLAMVVLFLLIWGESRDLKYYFLACFFYFMSFGVHLMVILFLPAILYYVIVTDYRVLFDVKNVVVCLVFILLGVLQYSYLFIRSVYSTPYYEYDVFNISEFLWRISGGEFKGLMFSFSLKDFIFQRIPKYVFLLKGQFLMLGITLGIAGICLMIRDRLKHAIFLLLIFVGNVIFSLGYSIIDVDVYFIPSYFIFAIFMGYALRATAKLNFKLLPVKSWRAISMIIPVIIITMNLFGNISRVDQHKNKFVDMFVDTVFGHVENDSIILLPDYYWTKYYHYKMIGERRREGDNVYVLWNWYPEDIMVPYLGYSMKDIPSQIKRKIIPISKYRLRIYCLLGYPSVPPVSGAEGWNIYLHDDDKNVVEKAGLKLRKEIIFTYQGQEKTLYRVISEESEETIKNKPPVVIKHVNLDKRFILKNLFLNLFRVVKIGFGTGDRQFLINGWSYTEISETGVPFCWAVGKESSIFIPLAKTCDYKMSFKALSYTYEDSLPQEMEIFVNKRYVSKMKLKDIWKSYFLRIPKSYWRKGKNIIGFRYTHTGSSCSISYMSDIRELAVAFEFIKLKKI